MIEVESKLTTEPRALVVVDRAAASFVRAFPYLAWRYGSAGIHDARDDVASLLATAITQASELDQQVSWVGRQMTQRGQPRWMLEVELELLARVAAHELGERGLELAAEVRAASRALTRERTVTMAPGRMQRAADSFATELGFGPSRLWSGFGRILCAAVIDERRGFETAVRRVREWAVDPHRFGQPWIATVEATLDRCQQF